MKKIKIPLKGAYKLLKPFVNFFESTNNLRNIDLSKSIKIELPSGEKFYAIVSQYQYSVNQNMLDVEIATILEVERFK